MANHISEKIIEDVLSTDKPILADLLSVNPGSLSPIARQKALPSGKLDLLYLHEDEILLIELKVVAFYNDIVHQINSYADDLHALQQERKLIPAPIKKIILVTSFAPSDQGKCERDSIRLIAYSPELLLSQYYDNFKERSYFLRIQSADYGVVRLGLLNSTLRLLSSGKSARDIQDSEGRSGNTIRNRLSVAALLGLAARFKGDYFLTDFGNSFVEANQSHLDDRLDDSQVELLASFVKENPFYSSVTYSVLSFLEAVFALAKSTYPVPREAAQDYFVKSVGKKQTWKTDKARGTATYIFSNYACELEFLVRIGNDFYITREGIQAILLLQLHRSIKLIESQKHDRRI